MGHSTTISPHYLQKIVDVTDVTRHQWRMLVWITAMGSCDNHPEVSPQLIYRLLQDLGSAVMAVDSERRILFINNQARTLLGIGDRDLSQVPISELASSGEISTLRSIV